MRSLVKRLVFFIIILGLVAGAAWIVLPQGSRFNLKPIKIPLEAKFDLHLGLDLQGGPHLVYKADLKDIEGADQDSAMIAARDIIERRVNSFGVSEPLVQRQGKDQLVVELPGVKDVDQAIKLIGQTPLLDFRIQNPNPPENAISPEGKLVLDPDVLFIKTGLSGKQLVRASADIQQSQAQAQGQVVVKLEFNDEGKDLFAKITTENIGKQVAIFLDGQVISNATVNEPITGGVAYISGQFTADQAKELATRLNSGALPVPIQLVSQQNVGATLGQESIQRSIIAGLIGVLLIALFMLIYYRFPGLLAIFALTIYIILSLAVFKMGISVTAVMLVGLFFFLGLRVSAWFGVLAFISYVGLLLLGGLAPVTLTLAGIAGFILSIGMAVDANILIFERLKEEIRSGKQVDQAIDDGFARAWLSIRDSNISSLITTLILYMFGTPSIKGFAVTLGIGIILSMFTAITITRTLIKLFVGNRLLSHPWLFGVSRRKTNKESATV